MPEFGIAGAEMMCESLSLELKKNGDEVIVVSLYKYHSAITERLEKKGIKIEYLGKREGFDLLIYRKLDALIKRIKPDIIHSHRYVMQYCVPIAFKYHIPVVHTVHNIAQKEQEWGKRKLAFLFYRYAHVIPVALSREIQKTICEEYQLEERRVPIVFNGEDLSKFKVKDSYKKNGRLKLLHIGRFMEVKNHHFMIAEIIELLKQGYLIEAFFVGENRNYIGDECKRMVEKIGFEEYIHFEGVQADVSRYLYDADVFVLPSKYEGVPMTIIEAMACGLPIIATDVGGISDMLSDQESAILIKNDGMGFRKAIIELYSDENKRRKIGEGAYKASSKFGVETMTDGYRRLYKKILNKS